MVGWRGWGWWRWQGNVRRTAAVLAVRGFCPDCGRELAHVRGGDRVGEVAGTCPEHGRVTQALTA